MRSFHPLIVTLCVTAGAYGQSQKEYDYIICGAGTAGLTVANRLTQDGKTTVLVVEPGTNNTVQDWGYQSQPQKYAKDTVAYLPAGKAVGGSSKVNGKVYSRPNRESINKWGEVNNAGWSWNTLWPFYKKSETLQVPTRDQEAAGNTYNPDYHGTDGPLTVSFPAVGIPDYFNLLENTAANFSIERNRDFNGGDARGVATYPGAYVIRATREQVRWSSADAYYLPAVNRKNLELVDQTSCLRVVFDDKQGDGPVRAKGVEIAGANQPVTITAKKEVILAAGVYRSPGILEYSGVGNKKILSQYNINSTIDLPGVGENYQDQMQGAIWFKTKNTSTIDFPEIIGDEIISNYLIHANIDDVAGDVLMDLQKRTNASLPDYAKQISERINGSLTADQILNSLRVQYDAVFDTKVPAVEFFSEQRLNDSAVNLEFWPLITMTRGSVHISGGNPQTAGTSPSVDPNWFMLDYDWDVFLAAARFVRKFFATAPMSSIVDSEAIPGTATIPSDGSDDEWKAHFEENFRPGWHGVGSCAMLPREWGGVVDGDLKVYGTQNVRVADASVIPFVLGGHPTSTIYAVAERLSELILKGEKG